KFSLKSHFDAITSLYSNQYKSAATFMVFLLNIVAIVQIFNTITFGQKKNPLSLYLITALTVVEIAAYIFYVYVFMVEPTLSPTYKLTASAQFSMSVFGIGILFGIA